MDAGLVWTAIGTVATCIAVPLAWRQLSLLKRAGADPDVTPAADILGISVAVLAGLLPQDVRGRDALFTELRRLRRKRSGVVVVLAGMGGVGKSTVAASFADRVQRSRSLRRAHVWWVQAADRDSLTAALVTIARRLGAARSDIEAIGTDTPDAPDRFWELLRRIRGRWLLVFDNADEPDVLGPVLPGGNGSPRRFGAAAAGTGWLRSAARGMVVVTSRDSSVTTWGRHSRVIRVGLPGEDDSIRILLDRASQAGDHAEARNLAIRLGCLPLALHIAGAYLGSDVALCTSFGEFLRTFDDPASEPPAVSSSPAPANARLMVTRTWEMSLDALDRAGIPQARWLLRVLSCYAWATPIPRSLVAPAPLAGLFDVSGGPDGLLPVLTRLHDLGLIDVLTAASPNERAFVVHPVVADANRCNLRGGADLVRVGHAAIELVVAASAQLEHERAGDWPAFLMLGPHLHALLESVLPAIDRRHLEDFVQASTQTARAYSLCGAVPAAERLMYAVLAVLPGQDHDDPVRLAVRQDLAWPIASLGNPAEAEAIYRDVLAARQRVLGDEHPETLRTRHELSWIAAVQGRYAEAEAEYAQVLQLRQRILGAEHPDSLLTQHELGWVIAHQHRTAEAEPILLQVLGTRRRVLGEMHLRTIKTHHELAWVTALQGRWAEADRKYRDLLDRAQPVLSAEHPDVLTFRHEFAWVLAEQGRRRAALREYRAVLELRRRIFGLGHPDTTATRHALERLRAGHTTPARHLA